MLRGLLLDNLGLKLVALLLAMMVYLNVFTERPATLVIEFPIQFTDLPDTLSLTGSVPATVEAELKGTGKQFIRLWLTEPRLRVSLAGFGPGRHRRRVDPDDLPLIASDRLSVERLVSPGEMELQLERKVTRLVPVAGRVEGVPRRGFAWDGGLTVDPRAVLVLGPERVVATLDSVRLESLSLAGRRDTVRAGLKPIALPQWCATEPREVTVTAAVVRSPR